jgi:DNA polymerase-4
MGHPNIIHVDMDAFFVSVEELFDPSLRGKPVVVGGRPNERGVVSAASYAARRFGIHSAMPLRTAHGLCPHAIFVEGHPERYGQMSAKVFEVLQSFSPVVEMTSIDEAFLDLTGTDRLHGPSMLAAHRLHEIIKERTKLNCSIGVSTARLVSKVCSDQAKPNGLLQVLPGMESKFLAPLDVRKIPGVGKVMEARLHKLGIRKVGDLARLDDSFLEERFGRWGLALAGKSRGRDAGGWFDTPIGASETPKSISHEHTFDRDTSEREALDSMLARLTELVARRLREHRLFARTVQIKLRYSDFSTFTRARTLDHATRVDNEFVAELRALFARNWTGKPIRLIGVQVANLVYEEGQMTLLDQRKSERWGKALAAADAMRDKYGERSIGLASAMRGHFRERVQENPAGLPSKRPRKAT